MFNPTIQLEFAAHALVIPQKLKMITWPRIVTHLDLFANTSWPLFFNRDGIGEADIKVAALSIDIQEFEGHRVDAARHWAALLMLSALQSTGRPARLLLANETLQPDNRVTRHYEILKLPDLKPQPDGVESLETLTTPCGGKLRFSALVALHEHAMNWAAGLLLDFGSAVPLFAEAQAEGTLNLRELCSAMYPPDGCGTDEISWKSLVNYLARRRCTCLRHFRSGEPGLQFDLFGAQDQILKVATAIRRNCVPAN